MKFLYSVEDMGKMYENPWFTDRERRVFDLYYRRGWRIEDIAAEIEMQRSTVDRALRSIRRKSAKML